jgi:hypothetical protein
MVALLTQLLLAGPRITAQRIPPTRSQEDVMKTFTALTILIMMTSAAVAGERDYFSDSSRYARLGAANGAGSYLRALSSANRGVVESALAHVAMIILTMPDCGMTEITTVVAAIERKGSTKEVRYKAWVVKELMDNPGMFAGIAKERYAEPDALFAALEGRMAEYCAAR